MKGKKSISESGDLPLILALETATGVSSVALFRAETLLASIEFHDLKKHAALLTPMIDQLTNGLDLKPADLDAVCISSGPGSYTGLRVGTSTAKGLALSLGIPLLSVGSLEALAWQAQEQAVGLNAAICPMIDARRMEVYCAIYDAQINEISPAEAHIIEANSFLSQLEKGKMIFLGDGAPKCAAQLSGHPNAVFVTLSSTARSMGKAIFRKYKSGEVEDLVSFEPFYLKDFVAKFPKNPLLKALQ